MTTRGNQSRSGDKCWGGWARGWGSAEATGKDSPKGWTITEGSKTSVGAKGVSTLRDENSIPETPMLPWLWSFIKDRYICTHMCACVHSFLLPLLPFSLPLPLTSSCLFLSQWQYPVLTGVMRTGINRNFLEGMLQSLSKCALLLNTTSTHANMTWKGVCGRTTNTTINHLKPETEMW